jgi:hypothetical protein
MDSAAISNDESEKDEMVVPILVSAIYDSTDHGIHQDSRCRTGADFEFDLWDGFW